MLHCRSRRAARAALTSIANERKRVWDHAKSQISILIGACLYQVFATAGHAMSTGGLIKQEVADAAENGEPLGFCLTAAGVKMVLKVILEEMLKQVEQKPRKVTDNVDNDYEG